MKKILLTVLLFLGFAMSSFAQDVIVKTNGEKLKVIIKEIGDNQVKYVDFKDPDGVVFTMDKVLIKEIRFKTGNKLKIKEPETNLWYYADDRINNISFNFGAIGANTLGIGYERGMAPGQSIFVEVKYYGLNAFDENFVKKRNGLGMQLSYRFKAGSLFKKSNEYRPKHLFHGGYFAPTIGFSSGYYLRKDYWDYYDDSSNGTKKIEHSIFLFGLEYGKEWILQKRLSIDASVGFHYYFGNDDKDLLRLGNMSGGANKLFSFNIRIGYLFGNDRLTDKLKNRNGKHYRGSSHKSPKFY